MKKIILVLTISLNLLANSITKEQCDKKYNNRYIFAGGECINYFYEDGDNKKTLNIIFHGAWKDGTNILARYSPFATNIALNSDIPTIAVALPGYSKSSTNRFTSLMHKGDKSLQLSVSKDYIDFVVALIEKLKRKYKANKINVIAHSAGAIITSTIIGYKPNLIQKIALAGGQYDLRKFKNKSGITINKYINNIPKNISILLIFGSKDKISQPKMTKDFYKKLKARDLKVKLLEVKNHKHLDLDMSDESVDNIIDIFE